MPSDECAFCNIIAQKGPGLLYEDKYLAVLLHKMPSTSGHMLILPRLHSPILEQVPDYIVAKLFTTANKLSSLLFDSMNIEGTNILICNGIEAGQEAPHVMLNIVGRVQGDGLSMQWQPKQLSEEEMGTVELLLKEESNSIGEFETEKRDPVDMDVHTPDTAVQEHEHGGDHGEPHENYLLKHIRRIP